MNVLSLFDGMSCGQLALKRAGIEYENYFASEIDKYAIKVSSENFPNTIHLGDVTKINYFDLPKIDLLIGGSPCQGFSFAGKQLNFEDPRSKLFFEFVEALEILKPKYFLLENVKMKKEYQEVISELLGVQPIEINSSLVSAQNRKRLYWTNIPVAEIEPKQVYLKDLIESGFVDRDKSHCLDASYYHGSNLRNYIVKRRRQIVFERTMPISFRKLTVLECKRLQTVPDDYKMNVSNSQAYKMLGNGWTVDVIAHIFKGISL